MIRFFTYSLFSLLLLSPLSLIGEEVSLLVFSKTTGFRHESISAAKALLERQGKEHGWNIYFTEDSKDFRTKHLTDFDAVIFLLTSGVVLNPEEKDLFKQYIENGGNFVGIHSACDTEKQWPWYRQLVGARFKNHPKVQDALLLRKNSDHPSTSFLPSKFHRVDEWYNFHQNPVDTVQVLLSVDEKTYEGGRMGKNHPISWYQEIGTSRSWYTAMGHTTASYTKDEVFIRHIIEGIRWAATNKQ